MIQKLTLSVLFLCSLLPMQLTQFGTYRGVQELPGTIIFQASHDTAAAAVALFFIGVWLPLKKEKRKKALGLLGVIGIVLCELYVGLTWYIPTIAGSIDLSFALQAVYVEYYFGLAVSCVMVIVYLILVYGKADERKSI